jgi:hypothetical protein
MSMKDASNRPKTIDEFIAFMGPYDPPLSEAELWHVQQWLDDPDGLLILRSPVFIGSEYLKRMNRTADDFNGSVG